METCLALTRKRQVRVERGGARTTMAQDVLNQPQVNTSLQQVRGVRMTQRVHMGWFVKATGLPGRMKSILHTAASHLGHRYGPDYESISKLDEANNLRGVIDVANFNSEDKLGKGKEMVDRLSNLVAIFDSPNLDFSANRAEGDDLLGDAYEFLMRHFARKWGKSKGQFYTPAEVSRVMAKVGGVGSASQSLRLDQNL